MFLLTARTSLLSAAFCVVLINYSKLSPLKLKVLQLGLCLAVKSLKKHLSKAWERFVSNQHIGENIPDSILTFKKTHGISWGKHTDVPIPVATRFKVCVSGARFLLVRVRIPSGAWMLVCWGCCVLSELSARDRSLVKSSIEWGVNN
jgi:hypothetical protein